MGGWIKIHRKITDSILWNYDNPKYVMWWIDLLLMANYKDSKMMFDGKAIEVKRGEIVTSTRKLSERWKANKRTVSHFLDVLTNEQMIVLNVSRRCTTIFISKYAEYQDFFVDEVPTECTTECTTNYTTEYTHNKKEKKYKEKKKGFSLVEQHDYDFEDLERKLLKSE